MFKVYETNVKGNNQRFNWTKGDNYTSIYKSEFV